MDENVMIRQTKLRKMPNWKPLIKPEFGLMLKMSNVFASLDAKRLLPNLHTGPMLFVGSDYAGEHKGAKYQVLSFLLTDLYYDAHWESLRLDVRERYLPNRRRMEYKSLGNDKYRREALIPFLTAANTIQGILVAVAINRKIKTLFKETDVESIDQPCLELLQKLDGPSREKLFRAMHIVSGLLAGFSREGQNVIWVTDNDDIVPNVGKLRSAVTAFTYVSSNYLQHMLGHFRFGIASIVDTDNQCEDLLALADLASGAVCEVLSHNSAHRLAPTGGLWRPIPPKTSSKSIAILNWMADQHQRLQRVLFTVDEPEPNQFDIRRINISRQVTPFPIT